MSAFTTSRNSRSKVLLYDSTPKSKFGSWPKLLHCKGSFPHFQSSHELAEVEIILSATLFEKAMCATTCNGSLKILSFRKLRGPNLTGRLCDVPADNMSVLKSDNVSLPNSYLNINSQNQCKCNDANLKSLLGLILSQLYAKTCLKGVYRAALKNKMPLYGEHNFNPKLWRLNTWLTIQL